MGAAWSLAYRAIRDLCAEHNLIHCVDPFVNHSVYGDTLYWRLHGKGSYAYRYTDEDLVHLKDLLLLTFTDHRAYILFNNLAMKDDAERLRRLIQ